MLNCENCGAPLNPYQWRCEYCGAYFFDLSAWDLTNDKPTFVKFKTPHGTITALAKPKLETAETYNVSTDCTDVLGNTLISRTVMKGCNINVRFECMPGEKGELIKLDTTDTNNTNK